MSDYTNTFTLQVKFATIETLPPIGKQKRYKPQMLTWIHAVEIDPPEPKDEINWHLVTNLPVTTLQEAIEKLQWYAMRWKIETFHKIMKSGCKAEEVRLRTAERLVKFLTFYNIKRPHQALDGNIPDGAYFNPPQPIPVTA